MKLSGNTILITGGAAGIGLALTEQFLRHQNKVIVVGRSVGKLNQLKSRYRDVSTYVCDVGDESQLDSLVEQIQRMHPDLNVLVNNAGIQLNYPFPGTSDVGDRVKNEIAINLTSPILLSSKLLPLLLEKKDAAIVNVSSGLGLVPKKTAPVYCGTKAAVHIFTKALRYQLENTSVKVFEIIPPVVDTDMTRGRGKGKITPDALAAEFMTYFAKNRFEVPIGKIKLLQFLNRWIPSIPEKILKNG